MSTMNAEVPEPSWWVRLTRRCRTETKILVNIIKHYPSTLLIPLVLGIALLAIGIVGVYLGAERENAATKNSAFASASSAAARLSLELSAAIHPVLSMATLITNHREYSWVEANFNRLALTVLEEMSVNNTAIVASPNAKVTLMFPPVGPLVTNFVGFDSLAYHDPFVSNPFEAVPFREISLFQISAGKMDIVGPLPNLELLPGTPLVTLLDIRKPVYIANVSEDETFGIPVNATDCSICYNPATRVRFWGFVDGLVDMAGLIHLSAEGLAQDGLLYQLGMVQFGNFTILAQSGQAPLDCCSAVVQMNNLAGPAWQIIVSSSRANPAWRNGLFAVVVVAGILVSGLLFLVLVSRRQHQMLLAALVPIEVVEAARKDDSVFGTRAVIDAGTPLDKILGILGEIMQGRFPLISDVLLVRTAIMHCWDLTKPLDLAERVQAVEGDDEVAQALMNQLALRPRMLKPKACDHMKLHHVRVEGSSLSLTSDTLSSTLNGLLADRPTARRRKTLEVTTSEGVVELPQPSSNPASPMHVHLVPRTSRLQMTDPLPEVSNSGNVTPRICAPLLEEVEQLLAVAETSWQFNVFLLATATKGRPLSVLAYFLMYRSGVVANLKLDASVLARYLTYIERGYQSENPYHNSIHAADVLRTLHVILHTARLVPHYADDIALLACYLAAIIHDYDHGGLTNDFLINMSDPLALLYNDKSPLENHHASAALTAIQKPTLNFLQASSLSAAQIRSVRHMVIDLVLGTDMKQHFSITSQFTTVHRAHQSRHTVTNACESSFMEDFGPPPIPADESDRLLSLQVALKAADLGHTAAVLPVHTQWLTRLEEEFFLQGDQERKAGLPISPLFDRHKKGVSKSQVGFYDIVVLPMYTTFARVFPGSRPMLLAATSNRDHWQQHQDPAG